MAKAKAKANADVVKVEVKATQADSLKRSAVFSFQAVVDCSSEKELERSIYHVVTSASEALAGIAVPLCPERAVLPEICAGVNLPKWWIDAYDCGKTAATRAAKWKLSVQKVVSDELSELLKRPAVQ